MMPVSLNTTCAQSLMFNRTRIGPASSLSQKRTHDCVLIVSDARTALRPKANQEPATASTPSTRRGSLRLTQMDR